jgi:hypothetical protein
MRNRILNPGDIKVFLLCGLQTGSGAHLASYQWVPGALLSEVNRPRLDAGPSNPSRAYVKTA